MCSYIKYIICAFLLILSLPFYAEEQLTKDRESRTFSLYFENDVFAGYDNQYTNGIKLTWSRHGLSELPADEKLYRWLYPVVNRLGFADPESEKALTFSIGQNIYTPEDIESTEIVIDDRPYAGIAYIELGIHRRKENQMHTFGLIAGIVGPHSYAEQVQTLIHKLLNNVEAKGWHNQLKDEPVISFVYDYKRKLITLGINNGLGGDMIFNAGGALGTIKTYINAGLSMRYGWNVPNDFGNFPIQPASCFNAELKNSSYTTAENRFGAHFFTSASAQAVASDIFLDGNTFRDSHSVDKEPFVAVFMSGFGLVIKKVKFVFAYVARTKSFKTQKNNEIFGSLNFSFRY